MAELVDDRWANIHSDLLNEVAKLFYSYDDYVGCRLVCKEWSLNLPKIPNCHRKNLWLVLPEYDKTQCDILAEKKIYHVVVPEMKDNFIRGSCFGWLICVMISSGIVRVLNPFTKAHFDLPPISALPDVNPPDWPHIHKDGEYTLLCRRNNVTRTSEVVDVHKRAIWKVVISSPPPLDNDSDADFMAAVIYGDCGKLAFWRLNKGARWEDSKVETLYVDSFFEDVIFVQDKIYAVDMNADLFVFDVNRESSLPLRIIGGEPPPSPDILNKYVDAVMNKYLIACDDGSLLLLVRHLRTNTRYGHDDDDDEDEDEDAGGRERRGG